jgi:catechol 2,3-dioxygenase-like lactoylglutathione lyase family enzyme
MDYKYNYTRLLVSNFKACFLFYRDVLGFTPTFGTENEAYADFDTGQVIIALFDRVEMSKAVGTSHLPVESMAQDHLCLVFAVDDVDAACLHLKTQGVQIIAEPTAHKEWGIRTAHFRDPDGNLIEINQPLG